VFWIPLVTQGVVDAAQMPSIFGNVELIATAHVSILDRIEALGTDHASGGADSDLALEYSLAAVECIVDQLLAVADVPDESMLPLYTAYGRGLLKRLEAVDALCARSPVVASFVDTHNAELDAGQHLKPLLMKPRQRINEYYAGLRDLRRLLPKKAPLETRIRELLPQLRTLKELSDAVSADDILPIKDDDVEVGHAPAPAPAPAPTPTPAPAAAPGPPPRLVPRAASTPAAPALGPPPPIVAGRGRNDATLRSDKDKAAADKDKDKKASFTTRLGLTRKKDEPAGAASAATSHRVYGVPLIELAARERRSVPIFVSVLCNVIEAKGLSIEGIFRTNESKPVESAAREKIERGEPPAQAAADPVVAASLIKQWLREMPDPLLTYAAYDKFITLSQALADPRATKLLLKQMLADLPAPHRACTTTLLDVCKLVTENESQNKMSAKNLAIVLGPNMLRPRADGAADHTKMVAEMQDAVNIVAAMIALHERDAGADATTGIRISEPKLTGAPVVVGGSFRASHEAPPELQPPPEDPLDDMPPPPPEPTDTIDAPPAQPPADDDESTPAPAPTPPHDDVPSPPAAQRGPLNMAQLQGAVRQRALATEVTRRAGGVARPGSSGAALAPVPGVGRAPPPQSASPARRGPPTEPTLVSPAASISVAPAPVAAKALLSPRGASAVASEPAAATATAAAAATAAPSTRSTDERLQALEASNTALLALTARLEERIAQLEQQLASK
jgi:hypothetical protein